MKTVKRAAEHTIMQRADGRYAVRGKDKKWINGDAKVEILLKEGLLKEQPKAKPQPREVQATPEEAPAEEAADGESAGGES
ncbi:MAG: hypothetical protein WAL83_14490 [Arenicellales bacterium]